MRPQSILCISAHWQTQGTFVTNMPKPRTIHDFYGFPKELFDVQYPAPGDPELAQAIKSAILETEISLDDHEWGLDHGTWSVLRHLFPKADIPVLQMSMDLNLDSAGHYRLGQKLRFLREQNVLIVGSGNVVHNLRNIKWEEAAEPFDWAREFHLWVKEKIKSGDMNALVNGWSKAPSVALSVPTPEHYLPLLYILGAAEADNELRFEFDQIQNGSISMLSLSFT